MSGTTAVLIALIALCGSYIQSVTGFGFGIFVMMFFPALLQYTEANVLSSLLGIFTSLAMVIQMRRLINWKNILFPLLGCLLATYGAVNFIKRQENELLLTCDRHNIPVATNIATAEALITALDRGDLDWRNFVNPTSEYNRSKRRVF